MDLVWFSFNVFILEVIGYQALFYIGLIPGLIGGGGSFLADVTDYLLNWASLMIIASIAIAGIFNGKTFPKNVQRDKLIKSFGWFILLIGITSLLKETISLTD